MAAKRPIRDAVWNTRRRWLGRFTLPANVRSILFVCMGNICRSPFAGVRATQLLAAAGIPGIRCGSAGLSTKPAERPPREACEAAARFAVSIEFHEPRQVTLELLLSYDVVAVMEAKHAQQIRERFPQAGSRLLLLSLLEAGPLSGYARFNIPDPFGQPFEVFQTCYGRIDRSIITLLERVTGRPVAANVPSAGRGVQSCP
jgi:protein-tyrosine phosphatase